MAHDLCEDLELVADDGGGFDDYYWDDDFHFHDDGFSASPTTPGSGGAPRQQQQMGDISASDYKEGEDMQGIPWERLNYTRDQYRRMRLKEYKSYQNLTRSHSGLQQQVIIYISLVTSSSFLFVKENPSSHFLQVTVVPKVSMKT